MRLIIQRVSEASVTSNGIELGSIGNGLLVFAGIESCDTLDDAVWLCGKVLRMRIFNDENEVMNRSVTETGGDLLVISQFTLHASTKKGNRPSYIRAARPETAVGLFNSFLLLLEKELGKPVKRGEFGAMMQVSLVNDGPVTIIIDSRLKE
jgi:D-tyrosyl-tRNA(Tyr) deacylase